MATISKAAQGSSIAMALAGKSASVEIPRPREAAGRDYATTTKAAQNAPGKKQHGSLPTPPNSISPTLPPNAFKDREHSTPPTPPGNGGDSDIDLQDAVEHAAAQDHPQRGLAASSLKSLDTAGAITPRLLAAYHLPDILLGQEPLAIRHIMGHLTTSVPGFSRIPSAKARRLVVSALEGRGGAGGEAAGGVTGDVIFEKVGWGRWTAREQGQQPRGLKRFASPVARRNSNNSLIRSPSPYADPKQLRIPHRPRHVQQRGRLASYNSVARSFQSPDLLPFREETEADRMSLDDDRSDASSDPSGLGYEDDDMGDETDEEDWAGIGAAALRAGSFPKNTKPKKWIDYNARAAKEAERRRRASHHSSLLAKSAPVGSSAEAMEQHKNAQAQAWAELKNGDKALEGVDKDDAEAVAALLQLGSH